MLIGEAMEIAMNSRGIPVVKVNYEDLGNWAWKKAKSRICTYIYSGVSKML